MFRRITFSILALGFLVATADATQMTPPTAPAKVAAATETIHPTTGRSAHHGYVHHTMHHGWHRSWHHGWHGHWHARSYGWHRGWHCHHHWYR